ncbi:glutamate-rich protein 3 [Xenentodon cancila]
MSHHNPGLISAYNSLTDKHLAGYFSNSRIRRHLQRAGLITRSGRIVPDKEYRYKLLQRAHQRHVRECLAQAIFHKVLEMERLHQIEIKKRLEEFARRERVHKIKVERSKRCEEDIIRILSPHPPRGTRGIRKQRSGLVRERSESSGSPSSSRPNTVPGKMHRPARLKPLHSNSTTASARPGSPYRLQESGLHNDQLLNTTVSESRRCLATTEASSGTSPYSLPVINNFLTPVPPVMKRKDGGVKVNPSSTVRGRRLCTATASTATDVSEDPPWLRSSIHQSQVRVNMVYFGKTLHLSHDLTDMRDEVKVFQQHCGGENLCVYKGKLLEGETFKFISRRHRGFPFSLTFFLNGLQVERLSSCCEFKHRNGSRLGGRHGHFGLSSVEGASPCYKCIIAMGLDKKPTPPPKRPGEDSQDESATSSKDAPEMETERTGKCEPSQTYHMETQVPEQTAPAEDKVRDDYEEDFEADDEGPVEETTAKEEKSSPSSDTEKQAKEKDASETEEEKDDETPDKLVTFSEKQQTSVEEKKGEEIVTGEVVQNQEEISVTEKRNDAEQEPRDNSDSTKEEKVGEAEEDESAGQDKATAEKDKSVDQGEAKLLLSEENMAQDDKMADSVEVHPADAAENDEERDEKSTAETEIQPDKMGQRAKSEKEDESSVSEPSKKTDEAVVPDNAEVEAVALSETMEIKAESSEEQDILSCEEAPKTGTEKKQQADGEDRGATSETEVTVENSSSLPQEHEDGTAQETADTSKEKGTDERCGDENKEAAEQMTGAKTSMNESEQENCEPGVETVEKVVEENDMIKNQMSAEEQNEEEEKQTHIHSDETKDENTQEKENNKAEDESNDENKTDESISKMENCAVGIANDTNTKGEEYKEEAEFTVEEEEKVNQENIEEQEKTDKGEDTEYVENKKLSVEPESKGDDKSHEGDERSETNMVADEKDDEAEKPDEGDSEDEDTEIKNDEECEESKDVTKTTTGEPEVTEEPAASGEADLDKEYLQLWSANNAESEDVGDFEAAEARKTAMETQSISKVENDGGDTERSEKGEIDAENGEISVGSASKLHEDEEDISDKGNTDLKTSERCEGGRDTEEVIEGDGSELQNVIVGSGETAEKHEDGKVDQSSDTDITENNVKEGGNSVPEHDKSVKGDSESEISGTESKLDAKLDERKAREETEQDTHDNKSDLSHQNKELDFIESNVLTESIINEAAPSEDPEKSSVLIAADVGGTAHQVDEETFESKTDEHTKTNENAAGADLSAADGENRADTEDASNASEEGASVLFKPQAPNDEADDAPQTIAVDDQTPEALARAVNIDLVTNWINMHQTSKFFETFVEPLEDLREDISNAQASNSDDIEAPTTDLPETESIIKDAGMSGDEDEVHKTKDEKETKDTFQMEAMQSKLEDIHGECRQSENDPTEATPQAEEKTEVSFPMLNEDTGENDMEKSEEYKGSRGPLEEDEAQAEQTLQMHEQHGFSTSDVQSSPENVFDNQGGESTADIGQDLNVPEATTEASLKPEGHHVEISPLNDINETSDKTEEQGEERTDVQLIQDIKHTLGKDRQSTFSVDEALFGHTSYPILSSARTESRH